MFKVNSRRWNIIIPSSEINRNDFIIPSVGSAEEERKFYVPSKI